MTHENAPVTSPEGRRATEAPALPIPTTGLDDGRRGGWIQVYSGAPFWPLDARADEVDIHDIAHSLSMQCRFAGHVRSFYSVAEHSVHVSYLVPPEDALWGLLHDATEAYLQDLVQPLKVDMPTYRDHEHRLMAVIAERFGLVLPMPDSVKAVDWRMLLNERAVLLRPSLRPWAADSEPAPTRLIALPCYGPSEAEAAFLRRFRELTGGAV